MLEAKFGDDHLIEIQINRKFFAAVFVYSTMFFGML